MEGRAYRGKIADHRPQPKKARGLKGVLPAQCLPENLFCSPLTRVQRKREALLFQAERSHAVINFALCVAQQRSLRHASGRRDPTPR